MISVALLLLPCLGLTLWILAIHNNQHYRIGGLYHPPSPTYPTADLLTCLASTLDDFFAHQSNPLIILAGDFNQLPSEDILGLGLHVEFAGPTHLGHPLDRIYASGPMYGQCSAIKSSIKTKHSAVLANSETVMQRCLMNDRKVRSFRLWTPASLSALHAFILNHTWSFFTEDISIEQAFDDFYTFIDDSLNRFFPLRKILIKR